MKWIWRSLAVFLGRKAWDSYQRRQAQSPGRRPGAGRRPGTRY